METSKFLHDKYPDLQKPTDESGKKTPVQVAVERQEQTMGERLPNDPSARIEAYLDRLEKLALDPQKEQPRKMMGMESRPRALSLLREMVLNKYVRQNKQKLAEGAAAVEERVAFDMDADVHYGADQLAERGDIAVTDLEKSLDNWIPTFLTSTNHIPHGSVTTHSAMFSTLVILIKTKENSRNELPEPRDSFPTLTAELLPTSNR